MKKFPQCTKNNYYQGKEKRWKNRLKKRRVRWQQSLRTSKLNPETAAKVVAKEAPERDSSPKQPTNIVEITCKEYFKKLTATTGPAKYSCFFPSPSNLYVNSHHETIASTPGSTTLETNEVLRTDSSSIMAILFLDHEFVKLPAVPLFCS